METGRKIYVVSGRKYNVRLILISGPKLCCIYGDSGIYREIETGRDRQRERASEIDKRVRERYGMEGNLRELYRSPGLQVPTCSLGSSVDAFIV